MTKWGKGQDAVIGGVNCKILYLPAVDNRLASVDSWGSLRQAGYPQLPLGFEAKGWTGDRKVAVPEACEYGVQDGLGPKQDWEGQP